MYIEFSSPSRDSWKYSYEGKELLEAAQKKHAEHLALEMEARQEISDLVKDPNVSPDSEPIKLAKRKLELNGKLREQCAVFAHEFGRNPEREFNLSMSDVAFFELAAMVELK